MLRLSVTPPTGDAFIHRVEGGGVVVGRSAKADLVLPDAALSRRHARFFREGSIWMLEDLSSRNGTTVNGRRVDRPTRLRTGDLVMVAGCRIEVLSTEPADSQSAAPGESTAPGPGFRSSSELLRRVLTPPPMPSYEGLLTRFSERLSILNEVHSALLASLSVDELLDLVLDRVFNHLQPHQGAILLRDRRGRFYQARSRALPGYDRAFPRSHTLEHQVGENKLAALIPDLLQDSPLSGSDSVHQAGIQSLLAVPMLGMDPADDAIGIIALSSSSPSRRFDDSDLELLVSLASVAAMRLINVSLAREAAERHRLARELTIARQIQVDLLPKRMPQIEGWEIFGSSHPSSVVSGDYYSVDRLEDGHYLLLIVDVAGRGIGASLLMGYLEAQLSCYLDEGLAPDVIFEKVSRRLHRRTREENFATAVLGFLDPQRQTFTYASAGHQPVLVVRGSGTVERAPSTGLPLGLFPDARYQTRAIALEPGDLAVLYTDGIIEAESREGLDYGVDRLAQVCSRHRRLGLLQLATVLEHDVDRFAAPHPVTDDRTLVMVRRLADA